MTDHKSRTAGIARRESRDRPAADSADPQDLAEKTSPSTGAQPDDPAEEDTPLDDTTPIPSVETHAPAAAATGHQEAPSSADDLSADAAERDDPSSLEEELADDEELRFTRRPAAAAPPPPDGQLPVIRIRPTGGWRSLDLREVWRYRELMLTLAWREISIRYKQTVLGAAWAIIQPLMTTVVFGVLFRLLMGRGNEPAPKGIPYAVSTLCAMLPWQLFAHSLNQSGNILVQYRAMITKIYFPRLILPAAAVLSSLVDFAVSFVALLAIMLAYGLCPSWGVLLLPAFVALALVSSLAVGLWLAAMNAIYRDFRYIIPFIVQIGMFVSPVVYSTESIRHRLPEWALALYALNPMAGVIEGFRWALLGTARPPGLELLASASAATAILVAGMFYFRRMERTIADLI